jgi:hypothetical protein
MFSAPPAELPIPRLGSKDKDVSHRESSSTCSGDFLDFPPYHRYQTAAAIPRGAHWHVVA